MRLSPTFLVSPTFLICAAGLVTLGLSQTFSPTAQAQSAPAVPDLRVSVQSLHLKQRLGGVELTGRIINTGRQTLSYSSVLCLFTDASGREVGRADGYLTSGPVTPGQSAEIRAAAPNMPPFAAASLRLRELGRPVTVQSDNCWTTVR